MTIIANRLSVPVSVPLHPSVKGKERDPAFAPVGSSILGSSDAVFSSDPSDAVFSSTLFDALSAFSTLLSAVSVSSARFFASPSSNYRGSLSVRRFRFLSKVLQNRSHVVGVWDMCSRGLMMDREK